MSVRPYPEEEPLQCPVRVQALGVHRYEQVFLQPTDTSFGSLDGPRRVLPRVGPFYGRPSDEVTSPATHGFLSRFHPQERGQGSMLDLGLSPSHPSRPRLYPSMPRRYRVLGVRRPGPPALQLSFLSCRCLQVGPLSSPRVEVQGHLVLRQHVHEVRVLLEPAYLRVQSETLLGHDPLHHHVQGWTPSVRVSVVSHRTGSEGTDPGRVGSRAGREWQVLQVLLRLEQTAHLAHTVRLLLTRQDPPLSSPPPPVNRPRGPQGLGVAVGPGGSSGVTTARSRTTRASPGPRGGRSRTTRKTGP